MKVKSYGKTRTLTFHVSDIEVFITICTYKQRTFVYIHECDIEVLLYVRIKKERLFHECDIEVLLLYVRINKELSCLHL